MAAPDHNGHNMELLQPLTFDGLHGAQSSAGHLSGHDFIVRIEARALSEGWDDSTTANKAISGLRGNAAAWAENVRAAVKNPAEYTLFKTQWKTHFKPRFLSWFEIKSTTQSFDWSDIKVQRHNESLQRYADRCMTVLCKLRQATYDQIEFEAIADPALTADNVTVINTIAADGVRNNVKDVM